MSDIQSTINSLELDYALHKEKFEEWKRANEQLAGYESYDQYVERFHVWEKGVFDQLRELKAASAQQQQKQQPVVQVVEPQLPMMNLDAQLNDALTNISQAEFTLAFFAMAQKDASFLKKVFEVVHRESKGTGYTNRILPKSIPNASYSASPNSSQVSSLSASYRPPVNPVMPSHAFTTPPPGFMPNLHQPPPNVHMAPVQHQQRPHLQHPYYTQPTQYGVIPDGWAIDEAIRKRPKLPSPSRDYRKGPNLPFKDFSQ